MKILVAEDNADSRIYLERILKSSGYEVDSAGNGRTALVKAQASPPDLIVSDILMPEMDGFALCRQWKEDATLRRIPFVFYTATYTDSRDEELALNLGADRFVIKPQAPEVLLQIIVGYTSFSSRFLSYTPSLYGVDECRILSGLPEKKPH